MGKSGKTGESEWTTLAAIVRHGCTTTSGDLSATVSVVALATGTKCVTGAKAGVRDNIISDCHAESLLKRAFKRYLLSKIAEGCRTANTLNPQVHLQREQELTQQNEQQDYYMFVSQLPCGTSDRYEGASREESLHQIRRKPGKGAPCRKASCTDKLAKWLIMGLQGRKLMRLLLEPIRLKGVVIGNCVRAPEFDEDLFVERICPSLPQPDPSDAIASSHLFPPVIDVRISFDESFRKECLTRDTGKRACPSAIVAWMEGSERKVEVIVEGRRQGSNSKSYASNKLSVGTDVINSDIDAVVSRAAYNSELSQRLYEQRWGRLLETERFLAYGRVHS